MKLFTVFSAPREHENVQRIRASKYEDAFVGKSGLMQRLNNCPLWRRWKDREGIGIVGQVWTSAVWICSISDLYYSLLLCLRIVTSYTTGPLSQSTTTNWHNTKKNSLPHPLSASLYETSSCNSSLLTPRHAEDPANTSLSSCSIRPR